MLSKSDEIIFEIPKRSENERIFYLRSNIESKNLRKKLKRPLGMLIPLRHPESTIYLKHLIAKFKPSKIISVGDFVTFCLLQEGIIPDLAIVDNRLERKEFDEDFEIYFDSKYFAKNPAGKITKDSEEMIKKALSNKKSLLKIEGEEDLLALLAIKEAQINSIVLYGIPSLGIVAVLCTKNKKEYVDKIISSKHGN